MMEMEMDMENVDPVSHHFFIYAIYNLLFHIFHLPFTGLLIIIWFVCLEIECIAKPQLII